MIKNGTKVIVDGTQAIVVSSHAAGKYVRYTLDDGRTVLDLHKLVESNVAKVLPELKETKVKAKEDTRRSISFRMPTKDSEVVD